VAGFATLLIAGACTSVTIPSIPPINIPSIPPINLPSGGVTIPTFPPIINPSGGINLPGVSIPPGTAACTLVTAAEVTSALGTSVTDTSDNPTDCSFITPNFVTISVQSTTDTDMQGIQFLLGQTAQQINVGGFPGLAGSVLGQPAVYVQKPASQLQVLSILGGSDTTILTKLQAIAAIAVTRMP
jgi:hypothetical protein